ncbi:DUF262 domain-containing protein [candidate division KSB1 bacterium]|nr:DUF262 domain-containing protein [candidate division KSB1 bacterium]
MMEEKKAVTAADAGFSGDDQIKIALQTMVEKGGKASMEEIYQNIEARMNGYVLSQQGKASLRAFINKTAVEKNYVYPYDEKHPGWRITPEGRRYVDESRDSEDVEQEETLSDDLNELIIDEPYDPSQINVKPTSFTVFQVMKKIKDGEIDLQPDFQRHIVWDETRQSRLIESILIRIPLPAFYLDAVNDDKWLVVDGLQRLSTLDRFYNKNELRLKNLEFLRELEGKTFSELPRRFQRQIEDHTNLILYIIQPDTPGRVKFTIFYRINTGGLFLTAQEIRHALFQGASTRLLKELAESPEFKSATTNSINTKRMDDRECVLRFLAFHLTPYTQYKKPDLDGFLSDAMQFINELNPQRLSELKDIFLETMRKARAVFGSYAFRKMYDIHGKGRPLINPCLKSGP